LEGWCGVEGALAASEILGVSRAGFSTGSIAAAEPI